MARTGRRRTPAFTLLELLVVITIILLVSAVTLPAVLPALSHRQVSEAARILQGALVQARDTAIRYNAPRGVRFLPDPTYNFANTGILAYNRMVPIEPAPEYSNGMVTIWPQMYGATAPGGQWPWLYAAAAFPPQYPASPSFTAGSYGGPSGMPYPMHPVGSAGNGTAGQCLMVEQAPYQGNNATAFINAPTSWFWNVRVGDKIQINNTGNTYTIVGPCTVNPFASGGANPEMFVNVGQPGDLSGYLYRTYTDSQGNQGSAAPVEFLYLVNGIDDENDGYVDNGWDGIDNNQGYTYNSVIDDQGIVGTSVTEWEVETWQGTLAAFGGQPKSSAFNPVNGAYITTDQATFMVPSPYTITRRPVPSQGARETMFPRDVVVDATMAVPVPRVGGGSIITYERSRLPNIDPFSHYTDVLLLPSGQVVPTTLYSSPASFSLTSAFYHFWLAERDDVHPPTDLWGLQTNTSPPPSWFAVPNPNSNLTFQLPMPQDAYTAYGLSSFTTVPPVALKGERMLLTLFGRTGQITANSIEFFDCKDLNTPFYDSQLGAREAK